MQDIQKKTREKKIFRYGGFSFIESMLSMAVLSFGILAVLPLITSGMREAKDSRDQIIASMLAQEGIELVQNIRDNNIVSENDPFLGLNSSENCKVEYNESAISTPCPPAFPQKRLRINSSGYYTHIAAGGAPLTKFYRKMDLALAGSSPERVLTVTSRVIWGGNDFPPVNDCNTAKKCAHSVLQLSEWY